MASTAAGSGSGGGVGDVGGGGGDAKKPEPPLFPDVRKTVSPVSARLHATRAPQVASAIVAAKADDVWKLVRHSDLSKLFPRRVHPSSGAVVEPAAAWTTTVGGTRAVRATDLGTAAGVSTSPEGDTAPADAYAGAQWRVTITGQRAPKSWDGPAGCRHVEWAWEAIGRGARASAPSASGRGVGTSGSIRLSVRKVTAVADKKRHKSYVEWHSRVAELGCAAPWSSQEAFDGIRRCLGVGEPRRVKLCDPMAVAVKLAGQAEGAAPGAATAAPGPAAGDDGGDAVAVPMTLRVLDLATNEWVDKPVAQVVPGELCEFKTGDVFPVDAVLLWSTSPNETAINTSAFDGDKNLRLRCVVAVRTLEAPVPSKSGDDAAGDEGTAAATDGGDAGAPADAEAAMLAAAASGPVQCPVCTYNNDPFDTACMVCGTPLPGAGGGDDGGGGGGGGGGGPARKKLLEAVGTGAGDVDEGGDGASEGARVVRAIGEAGTLVLPPPRTDAEFEGKFEPSDGSGTVSFELQQFMPARARLVFTERIMCAVAYVGSDRRFELAGGDAGARVREAAHMLSERISKAHKEAKEERQLASMADGVDPAEYEAETGVLWDPRFTNVPDDGNCGMHAFWLGLRTLLAHYPEKALPGEPPLADSPEQFRADALARMSADETFRTSLDNMLRVWLTLDGSVLQQVEDFFTLGNTELQERMLALNKAAKMRGLNDAEVAEVAEAYLDNMRVKQSINGRDVYVPLGEIELEALCRLYQVRLQTVKSEALELRAKALAAKAKLEGKTGGGGGGGEGEGSTTGKKDKGPPPEAVVDPRTIRNADVNDTHKQHARIVRLLNKGTTHYLVHLPRARE